MRKTASAIVLLISVGAALAQDAPVRLSPDQLTWKDNPAIPKGGQGAILFGTPGQAGTVVYRAKFQANYKLPPHSHPYSEIITVLSGNLAIGLGDTFNADSTNMLKPGSLLAIPANQPHFAWTDSEEAIIQVQIVGPVSITYVNPADDPRKK